ncbi:MAG TPA: ATP-binding cassette domain-containing protein [Patescibacteria group bacterium]|nr:ATP-binding cassette domain-containing protein [Patescibacteria group bacterium]
MSSVQTVVEASALCKNYGTLELRVEVLKHIHLKVHEGELVAIGGPSGSGKTTFLNMVGGIDKPTSGKILVFGEDLASKVEDFLANFRCNNIGFVFQFYNLVSTLTVAENIAFPMEWLRKPADHMRSRVKQSLNQWDFRKGQNIFLFSSAAENSNVWLLHVLWPTILPCFSSMNPLAILTRNQAKDSCRS